MLEISTGATNQNQGQYAFSVSGVNPQQVYDASAKLLAKLRKFPGFLTRASDYYNNTPNLDIAIRREQAKIYGVSEARILGAVAQRLLAELSLPDQETGGSVSGDSRSAGQRARNLRRSVFALHQIGRRQASRAAERAGHLEIDDRTPGGQSSQSVHQRDLELQSQARRRHRRCHRFHHTRPPLKSCRRPCAPSLQGEALTFRDTVRDLTILMVLAVFVMYVILAILYESYLHPLTVLSTLPTALVGGLVTLYLFGEQASLYAFVGMFMLMGIVKKNGIMIVDFALQRVDLGESAEKAIHDASMDRFRPILMTTLAAVFGAIPIALGFGADGASRRPLGLVIVGGLIVSQFITLFITPVIYLYLEEFQEKVLNRTSFFRSEHGRRQAKLDSQP